MSQAAIMTSSERRTAAEAEALPAQYLTFKVAGESYAVAILKVREILRYDTVTKVPATPRSIRGVMNLRGRVVPVVDLAVKLGLSESQVTKWTCVIIVEVELDGEPTVMGVMSDSVSEVVSLRPADIEPPPPFGTRIRVDYLLGMSQEDKKFILLLDIDRVLSENELKVAAQLSDADPELLGAPDSQAAPGSEASGAGSEPTTEKLPGSAAAQSPGRKQAAPKARGAAAAGPDDPVVEVRAVLAEDTLDELRSQAGDSEPPQT